MNIKTLCITCIVLMAVTILSFTGSMIQAGASLGTAIARSIGYNIWSVIGIVLLSIQLASLKKKNNKTNNDTEINKNDKE